MKILLIGPRGVGKYTGALLRNVERALDSEGIAHEHVLPDVDFEDYRGYDLYLGVGDEFFRRNPQVVDRIRRIGGTTVDLGTQYHHAGIEGWWKRLVGSSGRADYFFTHLRDKHPRSFYIGQGVNDDLLYPEHDEQLTIFVDHHMPRRNAQVQDILDQCRRLYESRSGVRVWYQSASGIVENNFQETPGDYRKYPFEELAAFYRKTHIFLPTHRETQGIVAAEIGMCGGLTLLRDWMYPASRRLEVPHLLYDRQIPWPDTVDIEANREFTRRTFSLEAFGRRLREAIDAIL